MAFYATAAAAEEAGYRACKRCLPNQPPNTSIATVILSACQIIEAAEAEPSLTALARKAGYSPSHFQRLFKAQVGLSPKQYAVAKPKARLRTALERSRSVTDAFYAAGYATSSRAYDDEALGMKPGAYRNGAQGETIRFATARTTLGEVFVAATARGVCMIEFGDSRVLAADLSHRFPNAQIAAADKNLEALVNRVVRLIDHPRSRSDLPLDIRGTAFQERVWKALADIAPGHTVSYAELAQRIGQPTAARAVAQACAKNVLAVAVPCHRVVRSSGDVSGYKWGSERKRALLEREGAIPPSLQQPQGPHTSSDE